MKAQKIIVIGGSAAGAKATMAVMGKLTVEDLVNADLPTLHPFFWPSIIS